MRLYVYCVCDESHAQAVEQLRGIDDVPLRALVQSGLAAIVSEIPANGAPVTAANIRAHNRVNLKLLTLETPLPLRYGTMVEEARLVDYLRTNESGLKVALDRVRGSFEMGVKLLRGTLPDTPVSPIEVESEAQEALEHAPAGKGTAFLLAKQRELRGVEIEGDRAASIAAWLEEGLSGIVRETSVTTLVSSRLIVRAAHLIGRDNLTDYRTRLGTLEREREGELKFLVSGPWPPYSFSEIRE